MFCSIKIRPIKVQWSTLLTDVIKRYNSVDNPKGESIPLSYSIYESDSDITKPPLVILHGTFGNKRNWEPLCRKLVKQIKPKRRIISIDARNHGDSPNSVNHTYELLVLDLKRFFIQHGIRQALLMGHSMGGKTGMIFALRYPDKVKKLIVNEIAPKHYAGLEEKGYLLSALNHLNIPSGVPLASAILIAEQQLEAYLDDPDLRKFLLANLIQNERGDYVLKLNIKALYHNFKDLIDFPEMTGRVYDKPCLFIAGTLSDFLTKPDHKKIFKLFPKAKIQYIKDGGHWLHFDKPEEYYKICLEFLNS